MKKKDESVGCPLTPVRRSDWQHTWTRDNSNMRCEVTADDRGTIRVLAGTYSGYGIGLSPLEGNADQIECFIALLAAAATQVREWQA